MRHEIKDKIHISKAKESEWETAMELAFRIFLKYEAPEYGKEGTQHFESFVTDTTLKRLFLAGEYKLFVAKIEEEIIGIISVRNGNHVSLLFVDEKYHRMGVASALIRYAADYLRLTTMFTFMTVNAAPYGIPFYHQVGFKDIGPETKKDGITYTPMRLNIEEICH